MLRKEIVEIILDDIKNMRELKRNDEKLIGKPNINQKLIKERISYFNGGIRSAIFYLQIIKIFYGKIYIKKMEEKDGVI